MLSERRNDSEIVISSKRIAGKVKWYILYRHLVKDTFTLTWGGEHGKKRKSYSKHFKINSAKLVTEKGYNVSEAARNLGHYFIQKLS